MRKKLGFTFIEVMIAITVFAIGVLAVLRLITQNLVTLDNTQLRTNATFLAKEGIELVYNMRDSNLQKSLPWDCVLISDFFTGDRGQLENPEEACFRRFSSGSETNKILQISFDANGYMYTNAYDAGMGFDELWSGNSLYYATGTIGGHEIFRYSSRPVEGQDPTFFSRYILFADVHEGTDILPRDSILKVESHVLYKKGSKTGDVVLESFIGNY